MKILSVTAQKPNSTGSGTYLTELVNSFARMDCEQAVVYGITPGEKVSFPEGTSLYPVFFDCESSPNSLSFPIVGMSDVMPYESTRYRDLTEEMLDEFEAAFVSALERAIQGLQPDLIICHHLFLLTAIIRKHFPDCKIVGISHGTDLRQMINCPRLAELVRPHIKELDYLFALHGEQRETIMRLFDVPPDKVKVIGSGYNSALFNTEGREKMRSLFPAPVRICYAGKLSSPKGIPELLEAMNSLDPSIPLTLAGGCQDESVMNLLEELPPHITWLGQIPQTKLADVFRCNDIFVLPSYFEGLPLVLIEAMASGLIPVCTDLPGVRPWIEANVPNHNAIFVPKPEMKSIDEPTEGGRCQFIHDLGACLQEAVRIVRNSSTEAKFLPDTSRITWDGLASRLLAIS